MTRTIPTLPPHPSVRSRTDTIMRIVFRSLAVLEAFTWAGLLISMLIKYPLAGSPIGVSIFGWLHGLVWVLFVIIALTAGIWFRWSWWVTLIGVLVSILPFATIPFDIWMERTDRLNTRSARTRGPRARRAA